jgi:hypothetical protein
MRQRRSWGGAFASARWLGGLGLKPETEPLCSVSGLPCQTKAEEGGYRRYSGTYDATAVAGWRIRKREVGEGFQAENPKPSPGGSVSGLPCQTKVKGGGCRW